MRCMHLPYVTSLLFLVGAAVAEDFGTVPSAFSVSGRDKSVQQPPQTAACGPNVLYMLLKAHERPVSADSFFHEVAPSDQGLSLADLRDVCARYGLPTEIRRCSYKQLASECSLPLIALLHPRPEIADRNAGHYVLVIDANPDGVTLIHGTSGEQKRYSRDAFCRNWKGYLVLPTGGQPERSLLLVIGVSMLVLVAWLILQSSRSGARTSYSTGLEVPTDARAT